MSGYACPHKAQNVRVIVNLLTSVICVIFLQTNFLMKNKLRFFLIVNLCVLSSFFFTSCGEDEGSDYSAEEQENKEFANQKVGGAQ